MTTGFAEPAPTGYGPAGRHVDLATQERRRRQRERWLNLAPILLFYLVFLVAPYAILLRMSFNQYDSMKLFRPAITLDNYIAIFSDPFYLTLIARTLGIGIGATLLSLVLGFPLALLISRKSGLTKTLLLGVVMSPLLINLVVRSYAWMILLGHNGILNSMLVSLGIVGSPLDLQTNSWAVIVGLAHIALPLMTLSLISVLDGIHPSVLEAARSLGASTGQVLSKVVFPLAMPGVGTGSLLVFCFAISAFVTPALLGGHRVSTVSTVIYERFTSAMNWPAGAALVFVLLLLNFGVMMLHARIFRER